MDKATPLNVTTSPKPSPPPPPATMFQRIASSVGFKKRYNFVLWFIFTGALLGFTLARLPYFSFYGFFCSAKPVSSNLHAAPGECWYLQQGFEQVGIILHLVTILPVGILVCLQFTPVIRHRLIILHRINGYLVLLLSVLSMAGVFMIIRHSFGGGLDTQMVNGVIAITFLGSLGMAYYNIKKLQIEQHRMWMLRAWFYAGSIITLRLIFFISATVISTQYGYYAARPCGQIENALGNNKTTWVVVYATMKGNAAEIMAAIGATFGAAGWLALAMHAIGVEIYLKLTPAEHERLRNVSYQRQVEAGMANPGRAGLTVDRFGDSEKWPGRRIVTLALEHIRSLRYREKGTRYTEEAR
ncbi:hypothetical protein QBC46DRAFT_457279 [Diplogelasinospora grovesii]|uniref:Uncharacterized protein n=1 Tax=Diplogelasinospora grovesii TaxID=303347 RepID=A0AAN6NBU3_9PEZI|nr:hypothetical protein QBC46DRAFT_457279 [Diplogelasinospora grovesii]